ncbi:tyrosine-type recombinase/integrase [Pseudomonas sp. R-28-1W-6]|nr:tyrosine-type recombinase/integrase [Pseudomonas sp. R-28-1W-6]
MRPGEMMALRWEEIDFQGKSAHVCRLQVDGVIHDRVKTKNNLHVLLNDRALHEAKPLTMARSGFVFAPTTQDERSDWIRTDTTPRKYFNLSLEALGIRTRRQYGTRHTYTTMCLMAGMNPAFIANQPGHSVQMLSSTYAKWLNSTSDWAEFQKLESRKLVRNWYRQNSNPPASRADQGSCWQHATFAYKIAPPPFVAPTRLQPLPGLLFPGKTAQR